MSNLLDLSEDRVQELFLNHKDASGYDFSDWHTWACETPSEGERVEGLGTVFVEKQHGGEGQGDELWAVFRVEDGGVTRYFRIEGYYVSFSGGEYDGPFHEVSPKQRLVTFYE